MSIQYMVLDSFTYVNACQPQQLLNYFLPFLTKNRRGFELRSTEYKVSRADHHGQSTYFECFLKNLAIPGLFFIIFRLFNTVDSTYKFFR